MVFFIFLFDAFLAYILTLPGAMDYIVLGSVADVSTITNLNILTFAWTLLTNPFTSFGFFSWVVIALNATAIFILVMDLLP